MDYFCDVFDKFIKPKSKYNHFKSNTHKEFDKCKHMELAIENPGVSKLTKHFMHTSLNIIKNMIIT